ncbi:MAG TPA: methyltransferase domain-containing protein [Solirubrobacteraceae bacterium]|nr:methyltransferase domain-containing protein [Solirubrobacteraceae bacterium]
MAEIQLASQAERRSAQANAFGAAASIYERARPTYPEAAVNWLLPAAARKVVDLGAGTGKLTRMIAARGVDVTAVDPSAGMLEQLRQAVPGVPALQGTAEQLPLDDNSVDAVLVAQAWHWVDLPRASVEVARVLKPGGMLGLIWNHRDERVDWVRELGEIASGNGADHNSMDPSNPKFGAPFGQIEYFVTEWHVPMTPDSLVELIASRSYVIIASEEERAAKTAEIRALIESHPQLTGRDHFDLPYLTYASRAHVM